MNNIAMGFLLFLTNSIISTSSQASNQHNPNLLTFIWYLYKSTNTTLKTPPLYRPNTGASGFEETRESLPLKFTPVSAMEARNHWTTTYELTEHGCAHGPSCKNRPHCQGPKLSYITRIPSPTTLTMFTLYNKIISVIMLESKE